MNARLPVHKKDSIFSEIEQMQRRITRRAYELFEGRGCELGHDLDDWLVAERELVWAPPISLEDDGDQIVVQLSAPGIDPDHIDVEVTPDDLLVEAEAHEEKHKRAGKTRMHEMRSARLFRSVHFPKTIDPDSAAAEFKNGVLKLTAKLARQEQSGSRAA
jgi:HSP20 family molecular chaperone IbpA